MSSVEFVTMIDRRWAPDVLRMMRKLYEEDGQPLRVNPATFPSTIDYVLANPASGRIVLLTDNHVLYGYALLASYWSNEWGGVVLLLDELFVDEEFRGRGIAKSLLKYLERERPFGAVVAALEVSWHNTRAQALYESMGFAERHLRTMTRRLTVDT
jgi:ribosomal protein S18 acetylase RimI-like enzyme